MPQITRRDALQYLGIGLACLVTSPAIAESPPVPDTPAWGPKADKMEKTGILTPESPGQWAGKEASHTPAATVDGKSVSVVTNHEMTTEHWIHSLYLRNQDGKVVGLVELKSSDPEAKAAFTVPEGTTEVTPYSFCNKHGLWKGAAVKIA